MEGHVISVDRKTRRPAKRRKVKRGKPPADWVAGRDYEREHELPRDNVRKVRDALGWCEGEHFGTWPKSGSNALACYYPRELLDEAIFPPSGDDEAEWTDKDGVTRLPVELAAKFVGCQRSTIDAAHRKGHLYLGREAEKSYTKLRAKPRRLQRGPFRLAVPHYEKNQLLKLNEGFERDRAERKKQGLEPRLGVPGGRTREIKYRRKRYMVPTLIERNTDLSRKLLRRLVGEGEIKTQVRMVDSRLQTFLCLDDAKDYAELQALPDGYGRTEDVLDVSPHLSAYKLLYYEDHKHPALGKMLSPKYLTVCHQPLRAWPHDKCREINAWEKEHARDVLDEDRRSYDDLCGGRYLDKDANEWFDIKLAAKVYGSRASELTKLLGTDHLALGRAICIRKARRHTKAAYGKTKWTRFQLLLASDIQILAAHRTCRRIGVFRCPKGKVRVTGGGAERTLGIERFTFNNARKAGKLDGAEKRFIDYGEVWTCPLPANAKLPKGVDIPTLPAIPAEPLPLPGEEPTKTEQLDAGQGDSKHLTTPQHDETSTPMSEFQPNDPQKRIIAALKNRALPTDALAKAAEVNRRRLFNFPDRHGKKRPGYLKELEAKGLVAPHTDLGWYRPDSPPKSLLSS